MYWENTDQLKYVTFCYYLQKLCEISYIYKHCTLYTCILVPLTPQQIQQTEHEKYKYKSNINYINNIYYKQQALTNLFKEKLQVPVCGKCGSPLFYMFDANALYKTLWNKSNSMFQMLKNCCLHYIPENTADSSLNLLMATPTIHRQSVTISYNIFNDKRTSQHPIV